MSKLAVVVVGAVLNMSSAEVQEVLKKIEAGISPVEALHQTGDHMYSTRPEPEDEEGERLDIIRDIFGKAMEQGVGGLFPAEELTPSLYELIWLETHAAILLRWEGAVSDTVAYLFSLRREEDALAIQVAGVVDAIDLANLDDIAIVEMFGGLHGSALLSQAREFLG